MRKHHGLSDDRPRSGVPFEAEVESESGAFGWPASALERVQSQTARAEQGFFDPVHDCFLRDGRSEDALSMVQGAHVLKTFSLVGLDEGRILSNGRADATPSGTTQFSADKLTEYMNCFMVAPAAVCSWVWVSGRAPFIV